MISAETVCLDIDSSRYPFREPKAAVQEYEVILGSHGTAEDFPLTLRATFEESDIVLHEQIGWTQRGVDLMDRHAAGTDEPVFHDPFGINE